MAVSKSKITIFMPLSRVDRVNRMVEQIAKLETDDHEISVLIIADNLDIQPFDVVREFDKYDYPIQNKIVVKHTGNFGESEVNVGRRRGRISDIWNMAKKLVKPDTDFIFAIEDDSEVQPDFLLKLLKDYTFLSTRNSKVGSISGIEVGRWGFKMIGAWIADSTNNPQVIRTIPTMLRGHEIETVHATGFYCDLITYDAFKSVDYHFNDFGPDVNFGLDTSKQGFLHFVDWNLITGHAVNKHAVLYPDNDCVVLEFIKVNERWVFQPKPNL